MSECVRESMSKSLIRELKKRLCEGVLFPSLQVLSGMEQYRRPVPLVVGVVSEWVGGQSECENGRAGDRMEVQLEFEKKKHDKGGYKEKVDGVTCGWVNNVENGE